MKTVNMLFSKAITWFDLVITNYNALENVLLYRVILNESLIAQEQNKPIQKVGLYGHKNANFLV